MSRSRLSTRELDVLRLLVGGKRNREIASSLDITDPAGASTPKDQPLEVVVDPAQGVKIKLVLKDANGNPIPNMTVSFSVVGEKGSINKVPTSNMCSGPLPINHPTTPRRR